MALRRLDDDCALRRELVVALRRRRRLGAALGGRLRGREPPALLWAAVGACPREEDCLERIGVVFEATGTLVRAFYVVGQSDVPNLGPAGVGAEHHDAR